MDWWTLRKATLTRPALAPSSSLEISSKTHKWVAKINMALDSVPPKADLFSIFSSISFKISWHIVLLTIPSKQWSWDSQLCCSVYSSLSPRTGCPESPEHQRPSRIPWCSTNQWPRGASNIPALNPAARAARAPPGTASATRHTCPRLVNCTSTVTFLSISTKL